MFSPLPLHGQGTETFDFGNADGGFLWLKLQMSPLSTPPRGVNKLDGGDCLTNAKLESQLIIKKPLGKDGSNKLPPPRFPWN